jgi:predicted peroxiredoxin
MSTTPPPPTTVPKVVDASSSWKSYQAIYKIITAIKAEKLADDAKIEFIVKDNAGIIEDIKRYCAVRGHGFYEIDTKVDSAKDGIAMTPGTRKCGLIKHTREGENEWEARNRGRETSLTVIISTAAMKEVLFPLEKALAAAVLGMDVNVVFDGAGVRWVKRGYHSRLAGWKWISWVVTGKVEDAAMKYDMGWTQPDESIKILEDLGAKFWVCGPSMKHYGVDTKEVMVKEWTSAGPVTWVDLLARSDVHVSSRARFEKP